MDKTCGNCRHYVDDHDKIPNATFRSGYGKCIASPEHARTNDGETCSRHASNAPSADGLTQIDQLRLHVEHGLSAPCLESLLGEVDALTRATHTAQEAAKVLLDNMMDVALFDVAALDAVKVEIAGLEGVAVVTAALRAIAGEGE